VELAASEVAPDGPLSDVAAEAESEPASEVTPAVEELPASEVKPASEVDYEAPESVLSYKTIAEPETSFPVRA